MGLVFAAVPFERLQGFAPTSPRFPRRMVSRTAPIPATGGVTRVEQTNPIRKDRKPPPPTP